MSDQLQSLDDTVHFESQRDEAQRHEPQDGASPAPDARNVERPCETPQTVTSGSVGFADTASGVSQFSDASLYADGKRYSDGKAYSSGERDFDDRPERNVLLVGIEPRCDVSLVTTAAFDAIANDVGGRVRQLQIDVIGSELVIAGRVSSYHVKQLVTSAVLSVLRQHTLTNALTVETVR